MKNHDYYIIKQHNEYVTSVNMHAGQQQGLMHAEAATSSYKNHAMRFYAPDAHSRNELRRFVNMLNGYSVFMGFKLYKVK